MTTDRPASATVDQLPETLDRPAYDTDSTYQQNTITPDDTDDTGP